MSKELEILFVIYLFIFLGIAIGSFFYLLEEREPLKQLVGKLFCWSIFWPFYLIVFIAITFCQDVKSLFKGS